MYLGTAAVLTVVSALAVAAAAEPPARPPTRPTVYAWFPRDFKNRDTSAIDWGAITHLSFRSVVLQPDGTLTEPTPRDEVAKIVEEAHANGVKVTVLVWGTDAEGSSQYLANHREAAARSLLDYAAATNLDGVNMDDESWLETNAVTGEPNRELVTEFFRVLRSTFDEARPGSHITWASPPVVNPDAPYTVAWPDFAAIAEHIDAFAIMSYTMCPPTIGWTGSAQPVDGGGLAKGHPRDYVSCIHDYLKATGGRADKLLLGIDNTRGGTEWDCRFDRPVSPIIGKPRKLTAEQARANAEEHGRLFDPAHKAPWYCYRDGDHWVQGWYQDDESLAAKLELVHTFGLQGVCIWVLDGAAEPPSTFALLREHLGSPTAPGGD